MSQVEGTYDVTLPVDVYCSLVRCALQNTTLGFQSSLLNPLNGTRTAAGPGKLQGGIKMDGLSSTVECLLRLSNAEAERADAAAMPLPPAAQRGQLEGELRDALDRVKSDLFDHLSFYHNLQEYDIPTRLEKLSVHSSGAPECGCLNCGSACQCSCHATKCSDPFCCDSHQAKPSKEGIGSSSVKDMLDGLKYKFTTLNKRIHKLEAELANDVSDPNVREYRYSQETKRVLGFKDMDDLDQMREHIHGLYSHLFQQARLNQQKIGALQSKLLTLTAHTRLAHRRQPNDKRNGL